MPKNKENKLVKGEFVEEKGIDKLTRLPDKPTLEDNIESSFNECIVEYNILGPSKAHYSVILFDVDYFKAINDLFGYIQGDGVLKEIGKILNDYRESKKDFLGLLGRWGGEEFLIGLPYTPASQAKYIADQIRELVSQYSFEDARTGQTLREHITISLGVSSMDILGFIKRVEKEKIGVRKEISKLIDESNYAMDYAKFMGRNRVEVFSKFLKSELDNIVLTRNFYFQYSYKDDKTVLNDPYLFKYQDIGNKLKKHFRFITQELNRKDTRTQAVLAGNMYRFISHKKSPEEKEEFLNFLRTYVK